MEVNFTTHRCAPAYVPEDVCDSDEALPDFPAPPSYSRAPTNNSASSRRRRHPRRSLAEHVFTFRDTREHAWALLRIQSSASSAKHQPVYRPGDEICGFVELNLNKEKMIQAINVQVRGRSCLSVGGDITANSSNGGDIFLDQKYTLWKPSMGDPRSSFFSSADSTPSPSSRQNRTRSIYVKEFKEKLAGTYSFPFLFTLPTTITTPSNGSHNLPPSLYDTTSPIAVIYEIEVTIQTALFKSDAQIKTLFAVVPSTRPDLPSPSRELIYTCQSNIPPPGPTEDPDGWTVMTPAVFSGTMFGSKIAVRCTMALANPLTYTRGYTIPLQLVLETNCGSPSQVLSILTAVNSIRVCLMRTITFSDGLDQSNRKMKSNPRTSTACIGMGVCWTNTREYPEAGQKFINSEIRLKRSLTPNFSFGGVQLEYSVALLPFHAPGLTSQSQDTLISVPVSVVASRASSSFSPISCIPQGCKEPSYCNAEVIEDDTDPASLFAAIHLNGHRKV